jgi:aminopeptidase YwaD
MPSSDPSVPSVMPAAAPPGLEARIDAHVRMLAGTIGARPPGSAANRRATSYAADVLARAGYRVERLAFDSLHWTPGPVTIWVDGAMHALAPSPFSPPGDVAGPPLVVDRWPAPTDRGVGSGSQREAPVLVCRDEVTAAPWFPRHFPFVSIPEQQALFARVDHLRPAAILALAASDSPEPLIEDGDFCMPYATLPAALAPACAEARTLRLLVEGSVETGAGVTITARRAGRPAGTVVSAHIDTKVTTPGALDNGGGVAAVLGLAEAGMLADDAEIVLFNGEDHYAAPGERAWLRRNDPASCELALNLDGVGYPGLPTGVALLNLDEHATARARAAISRAPGLVEDRPWFESDHAMFAMAGVPTLAVTSAAPHETLARVAHSPEGGLESVDIHVVADAARGVARLLAELRPRTRGR